jgi:hypothetical protein
MEEEKRKAALSAIQIIKDRIKKKESKWKYKIAVLSGKGGVGKSTVAVNLAVALAKRGYRVGLLDADIHGPDVAKMLGIERADVLAERTEDGRFEMIPPETDFGGKTAPIKVMTLGFMVGEDQPVIWRGPLVTKAIWQLLADTKWGELDFFVEKALELGALGARLTGAGFGGSAIALVERGKGESLGREVAGLYTRVFPWKPEVFVVRPSDGVRVL